MYIPQMLTGLAALVSPSADEIKTTVTLKPARGSIGASDLAAAHQVVSSRLEQLELGGQYEIVVREEEQRLNVTLPKNQKTPYVIKVITHVGDIEFIDGGIDIPPVGEEMEAAAWSGESRSEYATLFTGQGIEEIISPNPDTGELFYRIILQPEAARRVDTFNTRNGHYICVVFDREITNCSTMYHWSDDVLDILPHLSSDAGLNLSELGFFLASGPLPAEFEVVN